MVWTRLYNYKLEGVPTSGKLENYTQFVKASLPEASALYANVLSSSVVAAAIKPAIDGAPATESTS